MRKRTVLFIAALAAVVLVIPAGLALAGEVDIHGTGHLWAKGTGTAVLEGHGRVALAVEGDVRIVDHAGDAEVVIVSRPGDDAEPLADSTEYVLEDFRGVVKVSGSDFTLEATGRMRFHASGTGTAFLQGHGRYRTGSGITGIWTPAGVSIELDAADR